LISGLLAEHLASKHEAADFIGHISVIRFDITEMGCVGDPVAKRLGKIKTPSADPRPA
jgi:hypothetical protein